MKLYNIDEYILAAKNMIEYGTEFEKHLGRALLVANDIERRKISVNFSKQFTIHLNREEIMRTKSLREKYEDYLNNKYSIEEIEKLTERYMKTSRLNTAQKKEIIKFTKRKLYGTILKKYDKQKFNNNLKDWVKNERI